MDKVKTYIPGFDKIVDGGLNKGTITLVAGNAGAGKSIFGMQYIYEGIIKDNEPGVYISFEEPKDNVYKWMKEFGMDLEKLEKKKKFLFIEYTPEKVKKLLDEGGGTISSSIDQIKAKRLVIDSISSFALLFKDELVKREALIDLFKLIRQWGCTTVITGEYESNIEEHISNSVEFSVDNILLIYHPKKKDVRERSLEVVKTRGSFHDEKVYPFDITKKGIEVHPDKRIDYYRRK